MVVPENKIVNRRVNFGEVVVAESHKRFGRVGLTAAGIAGGARMAAPCMRERNGPARMDGSVEALAEAVAEQCPHCAEYRWKFSHTVAVAQKEAEAVDVAHHEAVDHAQADFIAHIVEQPDVVVADEPCYLHAAVGQTGKRPEKPHVAARHHRPVLEPVVEHIAEHD